MSFWDDLGGGLRKAATILSFPITLPIAAISPRTFSKLSGFNIKDVRNLQKAELITGATVGAIYGGHALLAGSGAAAGTSATSAAFYPRSANLLDLPGGTVSSYASPTGYTAGGGGFVGGLKDFFGNLLPRNLLDGLDVKTAGIFTLMSKQLDSLAGNGKNILNQLPNFLPQATGSGVPIQQGGNPTDTGKELSGGGSVSLPIIFIGAALLLSVIYFSTRRKHA